MQITVPKYINIGTSYKMENFQQLMTSESKNIYEYFEN